MYASHLPADAVASVGSAAARRHYESLVETNAAGDATAPVAAPASASASVAPATGAALAPAPAPAAAPAPARKQRWASSQSRKKAEPVGPPIVLTPAEAADSLSAGVTSPFKDDNYIVNGQVRNVNEFYRNLTKNINATEPHVTCDLFAEGGLLLNRTQQLIVPDAVSKGVRGIYNFDEHIVNQVIDRSGSGFHGRVGESLTSLPTSLPVGTGRFGSGNSARITGDKFVAFPTVLPEAPNAKNSTGFTASGWFFLSSDRINARSVTKGCHIIGTGQFSLALLPSRHLIVHGVSHSFTSHAVLRRGVWTHLALVYDQPTQALQLYVNGIRDVLGKNTGDKDKTGNLNETTVYLGGFPATHSRFSACRVEYLIDDLRISNRPVSAVELAAESFPALGAVEASFVTLGCGRLGTCNRLQAVRSCAEGYHLCTQRELNAGALYVARTQGWIEWSDEVWAAPDQTLPVPGSAPAPAPAAAAATSFLEVGVEMEAQTERNAYEELLQVGEAVDVDADHTPAAYSYSSLSDDGHVVPSNMAYSLLDAADMDPAPAASPTTAAAAAAGPAAKAGGPTPMPAPSTSAPTPKGESKKTVTTTTEKKAKKPSTLPGAAKSATTDSSHSWISKVALCCAYN